MGESERRAPSGGKEPGATPGGATPSPRRPPPPPRAGGPGTTGQRRPGEGALPAARRLMRIDRRPGSARGHQLPAGGATAH